MDDANEQARQDPAVRQSLEVISRRWGSGQEDLLRWSFIPREVLGLLEIKRQASLERKLAGRDIRRLRQLQTRRPEVHGEVPILRGQELRAHKHDWWALNFGLDKASGHISRQEIWGQAEIGLCGLHRPHQVV